MKNRILKNLFVTVFIFSLCFGTVLAAENSNVSVPKGENIQTDFIRAGETVDVASDVNGDVILAGANVSFSGDAAGDILLAGGTARVSGNSAGDVRIVGGNITLDGTVDKNVTIAGGSVIIEEDSLIKGNLYVAGGSVELRGTVRGNAAAYSSQLLFSGKVDGNADFRSGQVIMRKDANIGGNLTYASNSDLTIEQGVVKGSVTKVPMENYASNYTAKNPANEKHSNAAVVIWQFLSLLILVLVLSKVFNKQERALVGPITKEEVWNRIAYGLISLILNPIIIFLSFITVIGLPLAIIILFAYVVLLIAALALTPVLLGRMANERVKVYKEEDKHIWMDYVFGYILMQIIGLVPVLGNLSLFLLFLFSFGRITKYFSNAVRGSR